MLKPEENELLKGLISYYNIHWKKRNFPWNVKQIEPLFCWNELISHEVMCAKEEGFIVLPEIENQDDLLENLELLFCNGEKANFTLAKQVFSGFVFTEKALKKTLLKIYKKIYLSNSSTIHTIFWNFERIIVDICSLSKISKDISTTEEELESLTNLIKLKRQELISVCLLPIFPSRADFARWDYYYFNHNIG